jgi:hypothetical protein
MSATSPKLKRSSPWQRKPPTMAAARPCGTKSKCNIPPQELAKQSAPAGAQRCYASRRNILVTPLQIRTHPPIIAPIEMGWNSIRFPPTRLNLSTNKNRRKPPRIRAEEDIQCGRYMKKAASKPAHNSEMPIKATQNSRVNTPQIRLLTNGSSAPVERTPCFQSATRNPSIKNAWGPKAKMTKTASAAWAAKNEVTRAETKVPPKPRLGGCPHFSSFSDQALHRSDAETCMTQLWLT